VVRLDGEGEFWVWGLAELVEEGDDLRRGCGRLP